MKARAYALAHPGMPVPGTGGFSRRYGRRIRMNPYERPRQGGGRKRCLTERW